MENQPIENSFLRQANEVIQENIANEAFGVAEMAEQMGMSRSNLLRKIKKETELSASQFIRKIRLEHAKELLGQGDLNVSEVSFAVGFSSTSYFIKCFNEQYGFSPGELQRQENEAAEQVTETSEVENESPEQNHETKGQRNDTSSPKSKPTQVQQISSEEKEAEPEQVKKNWLPYLALAGIAAIIWAAISFWPTHSEAETKEKSIAVLPFINDSNDSTNVYLINGLMESLLNNLQQIGELRVISRTSVEKYRNERKSIPEIAEELDVLYFVEGSGQKIGDKILLNIQLIEAKSDKHLWAKQYRRETTDIFDLQLELAENITDEIKVFITPQQQQRMAKALTDNLAAYDDFLKGTNHMNWGDRDGLFEAIPWFEKAIAKDSTFASAYGELAMCYYYLDMMRTDKQHTDKVSYYADKALLYDPQLTRSLIAKAFSHIAVNEHKDAIPYLEKALELAPNSAVVINTLSHFYSTYIPNPTKYLQYALKGIRLDITAHDSASQSITYLHVSNALIQNGLVKEAANYINKSLDFDPKNLYAPYLGAYISLASHQNFKKTQGELLSFWEKDTTRIDILQEVGKMYYQAEEYEKASFYYEKFIRMRDARQLDIYQGENLKIAWVYSQLGKKAVAEEYLTKYRNYIETAPNIFTNLSWAAYHSYLNQPNEAITYLKKYAKQDDYFYWVILFLRTDPILKNCQNHPEFLAAMKLMEENFNKRKMRIQQALEEEGLL